MAWRTEFERSAERELGKLDHEAAARILRFLRDHFAPWTIRVSSAKP